MAYTKRHFLFVAYERQRTAVYMQFGRIHGIALAVLGALLLGFQTMLFLTTPQRVVAGTTESATQKVEHETNPVPGILGERL
jgi:hypothetical protein